VRYRAIIDRAALAEPGFAGEIIAGLAAGEEIRVADRVPVKLLIVDSALAMLPLLSGQNTAPDSVLVRASGLLDALIAYFEGVWARAHPVAPDADGVGLVETRPEAVDELTPGSWPCCWRADRSGRGRPARTVPAQPATTVWPA